MSLNLGWWARDDLDNLTVRRSSSFAWWCFKPAGFSAAVTCWRSYSQGLHELHVVWIAGNRNSQQSFFSIIFAATNFSHLTFSATLSALWKYSWFTSSSLFFLGYFWQFYFAWNLTSFSFKVWSFTFAKVRILKLLTVHVSRVYV